MKRKYEMTQEQIDRVQKAFDDSMTLTEALEKYPTTATKTEREN
ncbi:hypothetical protein PSET11_03050 [Arthrobacter ulcerisalmonis]|uniref:Uncharacterized protein n=1 Tax=Arthrobacter ulcerisalmonis TaxID=2483813 RepID=A0A3P5XT93_9MICC|nr:hypothetical protein [Arthrobacter ulcerisalmonis]VDC32300.1 hypothetical protein PSET11_03050 [Arthrobacter ulcerisalmonis]